MIVDLNNVDQRYGRQQVLFGVSASIRAGNTGLLGNNGAGKSTLIRTILGQLPVPAGRVSVLGLDPAVDPLQVRQQVGYMPENDVYLPGVSGLEFCAYCGQLSGMRRGDATSRAHEMLNFTGLGESRYREVEGYSTGMRQRVKLAASLVHGPRLLLLDEPTTGLDPAGREEVLALVAELGRGRGVDVIISSHILRDIEQTCDQVVVLDEGRVLFAGGREDFMAGESLRLEVRVKSGREAMAEALMKAGCQVEALPGSDLLEVGLPEEGQTGLVWRVAREAGLQVRHLASSVESLEQAYSRALRDGRGEGGARAPKQRAAPGSTIRATGPSTVPWPRCARASGPSPSTSCARPGRASGSGV